MSRRKPSTQQRTVTPACCAGPGDGERLPASADRLSLFKVALGCEAAAGLGCGAKAKPILQSVARLATVEQTWLSRNGAMLAVLWTGIVDGEARHESVRAILGAQHIAARKLSSAARESALQEPSAATSWYRGDAIDRLSEEEAAVIAARLVQRVTERVRLSERKRHDLSSALAEACTHELVDRPLTSANLRRRRIATAVVKAGHKHLEGTALKALQEAAALGHRPVRGEK